jgi:hypothetical protein
MSDTYTLNGHEPVPEPDIVRAVEKLGMFNRMHPR